MAGSRTDARGVLEGEPFSYAVSKDQAVHIQWRGRQVTTLRGRDAERFLRRVEAATPREAQLVMAKCTGNFRRGNERTPRKAGE